MKTLTFVLVSLLLVSCHKATTNEYCDIEIENVTGSDISEVVYFSKIDDGHETSLPFGALASGATSDFKRVLCGIYMTDGLGSGTDTTYQIQIQYRDASAEPQTVMVSLTGIKGGTNDYPDTLVPGRKYRIVLNSGSSTISEVTN